MLPVAVTYAVARRLRIRSIFYYLSCGAATGAALTPIYVGFDWHEDDSGTFFGSCFHAMPLFMAYGACGAAAFWYKAGRYTARAREAKAEALLRT